METSNLLTHAQHAYCKNHSNELTVLIDMTDTWLIAFDKGKLVSILLLNFTGHYGFSQNWINWMNLFLHMAESSLYMSMAHFPLHYLWYSEFPQGSCLGPLLYLTYISDLLLSNQMHVFADDKTITTVAQSHTLIPGESNGLREQQIGFKHNQN